MAYRSVWGQLARRLPLKQASASNRSVRKQQMPHSEALAERIRRQPVRRMSMDEKKMFGGLCFFLNGNLCVGVWKDSLVARVGPEQYKEALQQPFAGEFGATGRPMTGWVLVAPDGIDEDDQLQEWIDRAVRFVETLPLK